MMPTSPDTPAAPSPDTPTAVPRRPRFTRKATNTSNPPLPSTILAGAAPSKHMSVVAVQDASKSPQPSPTLVPQLDELILALESTASTPAIPLTQPDADCLDYALDTYLLASPARPNVAADFLSMAAHDLMALIPVTALSNPPAAAPAMDQQPPAPLPLDARTALAPVWATAPKPISPRSAAFADSLLDFEGVDSDVDETSGQGDAGELPAGNIGDLLGGEFGIRSSMAQGMGSAEVANVPELAGEHAAGAPKRLRRIWPADSEPFSLSIDELIASMAQVSVENSAVELPAPERQLAGSRRPEAQDGTDDDGSINETGPRPQSRAA